MFVWISPEPTLLPLECNSALEPLRWFSEASEVGHYTGSELTGCQLKVLPIFDSVVLGAIGPLLGFLRLSSQPHCSHFSTSATFERVTSSPPTAFPIPYPFQISPLLPRSSRRLILQKVFPSRDVSLHSPLLPPSQFYKPKPASAQQQEKSSHPEILSFGTMIPYLPSSLSGQQGSTLCPVPERERTEAASTASSRVPGSGIS